MSTAPSLGLSPAEVAFLCEMEAVTVVPRRKLESFDLLGVRVSFLLPSYPRALLSLPPAAESFLPPTALPPPPPRRRSFLPPHSLLTTAQGPTNPLAPPFATTLPLWLALSLKRQQRANISPPGWLNTSALTGILEIEVTHADVFSPPPPPPHPASDTTGAAVPSPPFQPSATASAPGDALPYHWLELAHLLLAAAPDDISEPDAVRRLLRDIREVRLAKLRRGVGVLDAGGGVQMNGVGAMEVAEARGFIGGVVDGLRRLGASREGTVRERVGEGMGEYDDERRGGGAGVDDGDDDDDDMLE